MASTSTCSICHDPLMVTIVDTDSDDDDDYEQEGMVTDTAATNGGNTASTVPDDVLLKCGCHFHWQCLIDEYLPNKCPSCASDALSESPSNGQQVLCSLTNEGGLQEGLDILPMLREEVYLRDYPEQRRSRAFLEFCRTGDVPAIVELLQESANDDLGNRNSQEILSYQDSLDGAQSGLHLAIRNRHTDVAWLLLLLASQLELGYFPAAVLHEAGTLGINRGDVPIFVDIRSIKDANNQSPEDAASQMGGIWDDWIRKGLLSV